ncbi:MAG: DUF4276 family protein [Candidatus Amulumruptor sp.]
MKRLDIIVEGPTEREFVSQVLAPYLERRGVIKAYNVSPIVIRTNSDHRGGMTKYSHLKGDVLRSLSSTSQELVVSMMIDFFRMPSNVPSPDNLNELPTDYAKADAIEACIARDINDARFIPYIQVHEFEAFLFAAPTGFDYCYCNDKRCAPLYDIINQYGNPEDINSSPAGAPSKRILAIIPEYDKVIDGNLIILQNGIEAILATCPRFRRWVETLIVRSK